MTHIMVGHRGARGHHQEGEEGEGDQPPADTHGGPGQHAWLDEGGEIMVD